jgi:hypothetical protein
LFDGLEVISNCTNPQNVTVRSNHYMSLTSISYALGQIDFVLKSSQRMLFLPGEQYISYAKCLSQLQIREIQSFSEMRVFKADFQAVFHQVDSAVDSEWNELAKMQKLSSVLYKIELRPILSVNLELSNFSDLFPFK